MIGSFNEMDTIHISDEKTERDNVTTLELQRTKRILYFSDGTMEELSESDGEDIGPDITDKSLDVNIDVKTLPLVARIKYHAYHTGVKVLNGIDYVGEGVASFLGITTPKYISESDIDSAYQEQMRARGCEEEGNASWNAYNNNATDVVITKYPRNVVNNYP